MYPALLDHLLWAIALVVPPLVILGAANPRTPPENRHSGEPGP